MKIVVQHIGTGRFLKRSTVWVASPQRAREFASAAQAIDYCTSFGIANVQLAVFSNDWELDGCLRPFDAPRLREESGQLQEENRKLRAEQQKLKAELDDIRAGYKEFKKQIPFIPRKRRRPRER